LYTDHFEPVQSFLGESAMKYLKDISSKTHCILERGIGSAFKTPYHKTEDFINRVFFPEICITDHPAFSSLSKEVVNILDESFPGKFDGKFIWKMMHPGRLVSKIFSHFQKGFFGDSPTGTDTWLMENWWLQNPCFTHGLEDYLDRDEITQTFPEPEQLELCGWRKTGIKDVDLNFWGSICNAISIEAESSQYSLFKKQLTILRQQFAFKVPNFIVPHLASDGTDIIVRWEPETISNNEQRMIVVSDMSMIVRNRLWYDRLTNILSSIGESPFILAVGMDHKYVYDENKKEHCGIHNFFEDKYGQNCLKEINYA
jgi:hypothetical protein